MIRQGILRLIIPDRRDFGRKGRLRTGRDGRDPGSVLLVRASPCKNETRSAWKAREVQTVDRCGFSVYLLYYL